MVTPDSIFCLFSRSSNFRSSHVRVADFRMPISQTKERVFVFWNCEFPVSELRCSKNRVFEVSMSETIMFGFPIFLFLFSNDRLLGHTIIRTSNFRNSGLQISESQCSIYECTECQCSENSNNFRIASFQMFDCSDV